MEPRLKATGITCHMAGDILPSTWHKWTHTRQIGGTRFTYTGGMEGWVDLGGSLYTDMVYPPAEGHPSKY